MPSVPTWLSDLARVAADALGRALRGRGQRSESDQVDDRASRPGPPPRSPSPSPSRQRSQPTTQGRRRPPRTSDRTSDHTADRTPNHTAPNSGDEASPGQFGPDATVEVDPHRIGSVRMEYHPTHDGDPDPGEIVWTWVPFEEADGRGKDRPVLVVAVESGQVAHRGTVLAVQLTSKDHDGDRDFVPIGSGAWDGEHRQSWVNIDRVMRVHASGMRREAAALDRDDFDRVEAALRNRYAWK